MDAVVLVGGEGTRLRPLTYDTPKQMLCLVDRPGIAHVARWLSAHGVARVVLSLGYRPDVFLQAFPEGRIEGIELVYAIEPEPLDTAGAVRFAAEAAGVTERFLVLNGDVLTDFDVTALVALHDRTGADASIHLTPVADPSAFGVVDVGPDGRVRSFVEKPAPEKAPTNLVNAGTYVLEATVLKRIPPGRRVSIERETFPELASDGALYALASAEYWTDTGTPAKFIQAAVDIVSGRRSAAGVGPAAPEVAPGVFAHLEDCGGGRRPDKSLDDLLSAAAGPLYAGKGALIGAGAEAGEAVLADRSALGEGSRVAHRVLMAGAVVEAGAEVRDSIVGPGAVVGRGARVGGLSIVRGQSRVPAGAVLDAARFPGP